MTYYFPAAGLVGVLDASAMLAVLTLAISLAVSQALLGAKQKTYETLAKSQSDFNEELRDSVAGHHLVLTLLYQRLVDYPLHKHVDTAIVMACPVRSEGLECGRK
jgi:hypothetical protein